MARPPSNDIAHEQVTDHWIRKQVSQTRLPLAATGSLLAVGGVAADDRDLGLAYAQMAARGDEAAGRQAMTLLAKAEKQAGGASDDHELHAQLGFLEQMDGQTGAAAAEYRRALASDPYDALAAGDLALLDVGAHEYGEAVRLWQGVFEHDPAQQAAGMNLAVVECAEGEQTAALQTLNRLLEFAPDDSKARALATQIRDGGQACGRK